MWQNPPETADLITFTEEIRNGKLHFLCCFISFMSTRPFDRNIWPSFIYSSFCVRPSDQKLGFSLIYFFYLHTIIQPNYMVLFHLSFLSAQPLDQKLGSWLIYFIFTWPFEQKLGSSFIIFLLNDHSTRN